MTLPLRLLRQLRRGADFAVPLAVVAILAALMVPLPPWLLDLGIALNLTAAGALLAAALYARDALQLASFPTLLLLTTLLRLALNVSSTRLALAEGHAGDIIRAFGEFVVRGDYAVGAVIFAILTLVQFLVVAKGAERVAEVSARFTLDAMPGKQMSIDADLRAGAIDQAQARYRRRELERESQLFGAMDGAMKFVKGDVIAGLVIVAVNLLGGTAMGVWHHDLSFAEALADYALIAIGDGLVSQIPSLCIAIAAGLVVTRVGPEDAESSLGEEIGRQLFGQWRPLMVVGGLCLAMGAMPGMPHLTFLALSAAAVGSGWLLRTRTLRSAAAPSDTGPAAGAADTLGAGVQALTLDLAPDLSALCREGELTRELQRLRDHLFLELGVRLPGIRVRAGVSALSPGQYRLLLDEVPCGAGELRLGWLYALVPPEELAFLEASPTLAIDPSSGNSMSGVARELKTRLETAGIALRTPAEQLCHHLAHLLRRRVAGLFGVSELQALLDDFEPQSPALVKEALQKVPLPLLTDVFKRLLEEQVSIRDLRGLLEALVSPATEGDGPALTEACRRAMQRFLSHKYAPAGPLYAFLVDPAVEETLRAAGPRAALEPEKAGAILEGVGEVASRGKAVLLASPDIRRTLRRLCEGPFPDVAILTYGELEPSLQVRPLGRLSSTARR